MVVKGRYIVDWKFMVKEKCMGKKRLMYEKEVQDPPTVSRHLHNLLFQIFYLGPIT